MIEDGLDGWRAVENGSIPTWRTIVGADDLSWLSPDGKHLVKQIATDLERIVGDGWIAQVFGPPQAPAFPTVGGLSPMLCLQGPAMGLIALTYTWLAIRSTEGLPGHDRVIVSATSDREGYQLKHAFAQLRIGAIAHHDGLDDIAFERPMRPPHGEPADLTFAVDGGMYGMEIYTPTQDMRTKDYDKAYEDNCAYLDTLARRYDVHWSGDVPADTAASDLDRWRLDTAGAAQQAHRTGRPVHSPQADGGTLIVAPGTGGIGTSLDGPTLQVDVGRRLRSLLTRKALQAAKCGESLLWVEDRGAMRLVFSYAPLTPAAKLAALIELFDPILDATPSLNAIVYIRRSRTPFPPDPTFDR